MNRKRSESRGSLKRLWRLSQKELKETSRDRRTIVTLLLMPLLVYPLLSMALNRFLLTSETQPDYQIGLRSDNEGRRLDDLLSDPASLPPDAVQKASGGELAQFSLFNTTDPSLPNPTDPIDALKQGTVDIVAVFESESGTEAIQIYAFRGDARSLNARRILVERLQWLRMNRAEKAVPRDYEPPLSVEVIDYGEQQETPILATIVPLVLVLMTITGAVYPAIDLTAGERERGTMEALMASPVPRFQVLVAKYFAVVVVAMLTAVANLLAMFTTLWLGGLLPLLTGGDSFPWLAVLQIFALLVLFSGFFSAVLLSLTSFARSFKEAQAYLIPVMLLSLAPGMLSLLPGVSLSGMLAIAPLINIVLLARELLSGTVNPVAATIAVISTIGYAAAALSIAASLFGSDAVTRTSEQSFGSLLKRPQKFSNVPSPQTAALVLALLVPLYFVVSNVLLQYLTDMKSILLADQKDLSDVQAAELQVRSMFLSAISLMVVFGLVPLAATWFGRSRLRSTFRMEIPAAMGIAGAIVMGLGAWAIAHEAFVIAEAFGIGGLSEDKIAQTKKVLEAWTLVPPWVLLVTLAATPAIIEELCFRGFLFSSLLRVMSPWRTILLTSFLFALFHVLTGNALLIERFIPSFLLGLILGTLAFRTGSVFPGIAMHFVHNGLLELLGHYHKQLEFLGADFDNQAHLPATWLLIATTVFLIGAAITWLKGMPKSNPDRLGEN